MRSKVKRNGYMMIPSGRCFRNERRVNHATIVENRRWLEFSFCGFNKNLHKFKVNTEILIENQQAVENAK